MKKSRFRVMALLICLMLLTSLLPAPAVRAADGDVSEEQTLQSLDESSEETLAGEDSTEKEDEPTQEEDSSGNDDPADGDESSTEEVSTEEDSSGDDDSSTEDDFSEDDESFEDEEPSTEEDSAEDDEFFEEDDFSDIFTVSFYYNIDDTEPAAVLEAEPGMPIGTLPEAEDLTEDDYYFNGWYSEGEEVTEETEVYADMIVIAQYTYMPASTASSIVENEQVIVEYSFDAGVFPSDVSCRVVVLSHEEAMSLFQKGLEEGETAADACGVDITFTTVNEEGEETEVQPRNGEGVYVSVTFKDVDLEGSDFVVMHEDSDTHEVEIVDDAEGTTDSMEFTGYAFSPYLLGAKSGTISVSNEADLRAVIDDLNASDTEDVEKVAELAEDFAVSSNITLSNGTLTILGGEHKLTVKSFLLKGSATLNLNTEDSSDPFQIVSSDNTNPVFDLTGKSVLNIYKGTTIGPSTGGGTPGGINAHDHSTTNMYGGTITDCVGPLSTSGAVYLDNYSTFNMYDGTIDSCSGKQGGAIGLSGAKPLGGDMTSAVTFNMSGGTISNCVDNFIGGGAICVYTPYPVNINMSGGTIEKCSGLYGGGIIIYTTDTSSNIQLTGGTITGNSAEAGGGVFVYSGNVTIANGFSLHNNTATTYGGDDLYNNGPYPAKKLYPTVTLGTPDTTATLNTCGHKITDWYEDRESRWHRAGCSEEDGEDHLVLYQHLNEACGEEFGLKAAHGDPVTYIVHFDPNGGKGSMDDMTLTCDEPEKLTANSFSRDYFRFLGWNTKDDGSGDNYDDEEEVVNLTTEPNTTVTLYAQWERTRTSISGTKIWEDDGKDHNNADELALTLHRISAKPDSAEETVDAKPVWDGNKYTYEDLYTCDIEGYLYTYYVTEARSRNIFLLYTAAVIQRRPMTVKRSPIHMEQSILQSRRCGTMPTIRTDCAKT